MFCRALRRGPQGRPVQVDPIKPTLTAPGSKRLKLKHDEPLSSSAFKFNLRRYTKEAHYDLRSLFPVLDLHVPVIIAAFCGTGEAPALLGKIKAGGLFD
jgi:hypothetical protein